MKLIGITRITYSLIVSMLVPMISTVGPTTRKKTISRMVSPPLRLPRNCTPRSTPDTAENTNRIVMTTMIAIATLLETSSPVRKFSPLLICSAPSPSDVAVPKSVAKMARMSTTRPIGRSLARGPSSGTSVPLTRFVPVLRRNAQ